MRHADQILADNGKGTPPGTTTVPATTVPATTVPETTAPPTTSPADEETEDQLLERLAKKRGVDKSKLSLQLTPDADLTPEQKTAAAKEAKEKAFKYGLDNKLFSQDKYDQFVLDTAKPKADIAFSAFKADFIKELEGSADADSYNDDDIKEIFDNLHFTSDDENSPRKKLANKRLEKAVQDYMNAQYGDVLTVEQKFAANQELEQKTHTYKGIVEQAFTQLPAQLTYDVDGVKIPFTPTAEALSAVKDLYLNSKAFETFGGATQQSIQDAAIKNLAISDLPRLLTEVSQAYHAEKVKTLKLGRHGIPPEREVGSQSGGGGSMRHSDRMMEAAKNAR